MRVQSFGVAGNPGDEVTDFEAAYRQYAPLVRRVLSRRGVRATELDDALHDVFVTIHRLLPQFEGRASLATWIHAIAWRSAAGHLRRTYRRREIAAVIDEPSTDETPNGPAGIESLHASLSALAPEDRDLIALHEVGGLSIAELSELTGSARATIAQRIARAKLKLSRKLSQAAGSALDANPAPVSSSGDSTTASGAQRWPTDYYEGPGYCFSRVGDSLLAVWRGPSHADAIQTITHMLLDAAEHAPHGVTYLNVIEGSSSAPDCEGRQLLGWACAKLGNKLRAAAFVPETPGMRALAVPIVNTYVFLSRNPLNLRFFGELGLGASWIAQQGGAPAESLIAEIEAMRARLDLQRARCSRRVS